MAMIIKSPLLCLCPSWFPEHLALWQSYRHKSHVYYPSSGKLLGSPAFSIKKCLLASFSLNFPNSYSLDKHILSSLGWLANFPFTFGGILHQLLTIWKPCLEVPGSGVLLLVEEYGRTPLSQKSLFLASLEM